MALVFRVFSLALCVVSSVPSTMLFSDVAVHSQTGDVLATELTLEILTDNRVGGTLRHFEGSCEAETIHLDGTRKGEELTMSGTLTGREVRLQGKLTEKAFVGTVLFQLPGQAHTVDVRLPIVKGHKLCS